MNTSYSHLDIASYAEWWNVYLSMGVAVRRFLKKSLNLETTNVILSIIFYIGGQIYGKVIYTAGKM